MQLYYHSLTHLTEARFASSLYPVYLGFCFSGLPSDAINPVLFSKIKPWLSGAELVGQFAYEPAQSIINQMDLLGLTCVEVPHDHPSVDVLMDSFSVITLGGFIAGAQAYRMDYTQYQNLAQPNTTVPCFLDFARPNVVHIQEVLTQHTALGLAYKGGVQESEPGMADLSAPAAFMESLGLL